QGKEPTHPGEEPGLRNHQPVSTAPRKADRRSHSLFQSPWRLGEPSHRRNRGASIMTDTKNTVSDERLDRVTAEDRLRLHAHDPDTFAFSPDDAETLVEEIDALRASIPGGVGVKVKPLEWSIERDGDALCWRASDPLGGWAYIRIHTDDELGE